MTTYNFSTLANSQTPTPVVDFDPTTDQLRFDGVQYQANQLRVQETKDGTKDVLVLNYLAKGSCCVE